MVQLESRWGNSLSIRCVIFLPNSGVTIIGNVENGHVLNMTKFGSVNASCDFPMNKNG